MGYAPVCSLSTTPLPISSFTPSSKEIKLSLLVQNNKNSQRKLFLEAKRFQTSFSLTGAAEHKASAEKAD